MHSCTIGSGRNNIYLTIRYRKAEKCRCSKELIRIPFRSVVSSYRKILFAVL